MHFIVKLQASVYTRSHKRPTSISFAGIPTATRGRNICRANAEPYGI